VTVLTPARATDVVTLLALASLVLAAAFFVLRPELWRRLWLVRVDPRPVALTRIAFGLVVLWGFVALAGDARVLFSDEGMWLPEQARARFGGGLRLTLLHLWSPPSLVFALYALMLVALALMTLGLWTRWTTLAAWGLVLQIQRYQFMHYSGADLVIANFLFLGLLSGWGEAYSLDRWRRRRAGTDTDHRLIPAWPMRLMMLQLVLIYCATGLLKRGELWANGEALYYALNLDHFYRIPAHAMVAWLQATGVLPVLTHLVRWWEVLFPLALVGVGLRGYEADRRAGRWRVPPAWRRRLSWLVAGGVWLLLAVAAGLVAVYHGPPGSTPVGSPRRQLAVTALIVVIPIVVVPVYRLIRRRPGLHAALLQWVLGKRVWLVAGLLLHLGIDLFINVGTFAELMLAVYVVWLTPAELDAARAFLGLAPRPAAEAVALRTRAGGP
jgi:hypothetical protein